MAQSANHRLPPHLGVVDGHLAIDGQDVVALAAEHGSPLFVYSERRVTDNAGGFLRAARESHPRAQAFFASKACSNLHILRVIREEGLGVEVNSGGELWKALAAGFQPQDIVFNGVAKTVDELREAIGCGIKAINVESAFELQRIADVARNLGKRAAVALRLVPGIGGSATAGLQTGNASSKFGMTQPELQAALDIAHAHRQDLDVAGMHLHIGSQVAGAREFAAAVAFTARMSREIGAALGTRLRLLNLGGGYPVDYAHLNQGDNRGNSDALRSFTADEAAAPMVGAVAAQAARELGTEMELLFEPGRALVADAAFLLTRVENTRLRGDLPWLYLDAGYNLLIDSAAVRWYYHMVNVGRMDAPADRAYRVVGPLCDSADCFFDVEGEYLWKALSSRLSALSPEAREELRAEIVRLPETRNLPATTAPGDLIALLDTGAYALGEMFQYCGRLRAKAVMVDRQGGVKVLRERDQPGDLIGPAEKTVISVPA
ncbi:MAG TPA: diaminopimelate decarboxylase [Dongiaceae bacterium]|nr:diaminopimelate decarboxylase [Dongiaceae bacterium]